MDRVIGGLISPHLHSALAVPHPQRPGQLLALHRQAELCMVLAAVSPWSTAFQGQEGTVAQEQLQQH